MTGTDQGAAFPSEQGKHVAGGGDVVPGAVGIGRDGDRMRAIGSRNSGGHTLPGLDGHGERRLMAGAVLLAHERQAQSVDPLLGQREADQAAGVFGHEVDGIGGRELGGDDQVAFILPVFVVHQDEHAAIARFLD